MAAGGELETLLNPLPVDLRKVLINYTRAWVKSLSLGAPGADDSVAAGNFRAAIVPVTTSGTANQEVAVAHGMGRTPRLAIPCVALNTVNAHVPAFTITQAADSRYLYLKSATQNASFWLLVE